MEFRVHATTKMNYNSCIPYGAYISRVFNFVNFESFAKFISVKILMATVLYMEQRAGLQNYFNEISKNSNSQKIRPAKYKRHTVYAYKHEVTHVVIVACNYPF